MDEIRRVAFLGLGIMGSAMAANLRRSGFEVSVWNRTRARADALAAASGAHSTKTPAEAAARSEATITMLVDAPQVEAVLFGSGGAVEGMREGHLAIDMSTISPTASRSIAERLAERGTRFLDAPVTGSKPEAQAGTLRILVGGAEEDFRRAKPLFQAMGEFVLHVGPQGHGSTIKLINNSLGATNAAALAEALVFARTAGVDLDATLEIVSGGAGGSRALDLKARRMLGHDFEAAFKLEHSLKDVRHTLEEAARLGAPLTLTQQAERLLAEADGAGHGTDDYAAVIVAAERAAAAQPGT